MASSHRLKPLVQILALMLSTQLVACSSLSEMISGDKVDYRTSGGKKGPGLEVPPDLTQLAQDQRYQSPKSVVSASTFQSPATVAAAPVTMAPTSAGDLQMERSGNQRWLSTPQPPERLWPQLQSFWAERGFVLTVDQADVGVMETEWAENRAKLPQDIIRQTVGKVFDSLYSTGERDKFRTRVERTAKGSEIYISHRGMVEVYSDKQKDSTVWQPRPSDPQLEAELLQRLMIKLGAKEDVVKATMADGKLPEARARTVPGTPASLQLDESFDRAWRRVGLALDRTGFTVEDRDRSQGVYFVRYVDPKQAKKEEPGLFSRIFSFGKTDDAASHLARYRVNVKGSGDRSTVTILSAQGGNDTGDVGQQIVKLLVEDLK